MVIDVILVCFGIFFLIINIILNFLMVCVKESMMFVSKEGCMFGSKILVRVVYWDFFKM